MSVSNDRSPRDSAGTNPDSDAAPSTAEILDVQLQSQNRWTSLTRLRARIAYAHASPRLLVERALSSLGIGWNSPRSVLELGFGHGHVLFSFGKHVGIHGVELSPIALEAARRRVSRSGHRNHSFKLAKEDGCLLDYPSGAFDVVISSHTLEHSADDCLALSEIERVLSPGGHLVLVVPIDDKHSAARISPNSRRHPDFPESTYHVWLFNGATIEHLLKEARFEEVRVQEKDRVQSARRRWPKWKQVCHAVLYALAPSIVERIAERGARRRGDPYSQVLAVATKRHPEAPR